MKRADGRAKTRGRRILVTGGAGYIGSHTAKALAGAGYTPVVLDNLTEGHRWAVQWGPLIVGDLEDTDLLRTVLVEERIDAVIHFAGSAYVGESMTQPKRYFHNNVINSLGLLDAMLETGIRQIVFSSTCATYGAPRRLPIDEEHPQAPLSPYGESKLLIEQVLHWYAPAYELRWVALRYFNAAGADPEGDIGEMHDPETHLVPLAIEAALGRSSRLDIYGHDYQTPDGTAIRDFIHVSDLASGHVQALQYLLAGGSSQAINLGTGRGHSVKEVVAMVEATGQHQVPVHYAARRRGDPAALVANTQRAQSVLGWNPRFPDLQAIVESAWSWHVGA